MPAREEVTHVSVADGSVGIKCVLVSKKEKNIQALS